MGTPGKGVRSPLYKAGKDTGKNLITRLLQFGSEMSLKGWNYPKLGTVVSGGTFKR